MGVAKQRPWGRLGSEAFQEEQTVRLEGSGRVAGDEDRDHPGLFILSDRSGGPGGFEQRRT